MVKEKKFKDYLLNDIPEDVHAKMKVAAKANRIPMRLWIIDAIKRKLEEDK